MIAFSVVVGEQSKQTKEQGPHIRVISYDAAMYGPIRHSSAVEFIRGVYMGAGLSTAMPPTATSNTLKSSSFSSMSDKTITDEFQIPEIKSQSDWSTHCAETYRG